jgi:hypothetical protein
MKKYFVYIDGKQSEPLSFEELKDLSIDKNTLIWYKGLTNWETAGKLDELSEIWKVSDEIKDTDFQEPRNYSKYWLGGIALVVFLILFCGFFYYKNSKSVSSDRKTVGLTNKVESSKNLSNMPTLLKLAIKEKFENYLPKIKESHLDYEFVDYSIDLQDQKADNLSDFIILTFRLRSKKDKSSFLSGIAIYEAKGLDDKGKPKIIVTDGEEVNEYIKFSIIQDGEIIYDVLRYQTNDKNCCPSYIYGKLLVKYKNKKLTTKIYLTVKLIKIDDLKNEESNEENFDFYGVYFGLQSSYNLKDEYGNDLIYRGRKGTVPVTYNKFKIEKNGRVTLEQSNLDKPANIDYYNGFFSITSQNNDRTIILCKMQSDDSVPSFEIEVNHFNDNANCKPETKYTPQFNLRKLN